MTSYFSHSRSAFSVFYCAACNTGKICLFLFLRSTLWYPEAPIHYPVPGAFAYHYLLGPDRMVHDRQRAFHATEAEAGVLQVRQLRLVN